MVRGKLPQQFIFLPHPRNTNTHGLHFATFAFNFDSATGLEYEENSQQTPRTNTLEQLLPPALNNAAPVTGKTTRILRKENKRRRLLDQVEQSAGTDWWTRHEGNFELPPALPPLDKHLNSMCPRGLALHHPAAPLLIDFATLGCPTETGQPWTIPQMQAAIDRGPHKSTLLEDARTQLRAEVMEKITKGQAKLVQWDDIKHDPPPQLKISPVAMIPHKSRSYRAILDLSFPVKLQDGTIVPSVNEATTKTAPRGAINQIGHSLQRIIHAFAATDDDSKIFMAKWDIKDGFWRLNCQTGEEWNFAYVLPPLSNEPTQLVIPTSLQMGWIESPPYFCTASETARDVANQYAQLPLGQLDDHKFLPWTELGEDYLALPEYSTDTNYRYLLEVYMDDYIKLAIPTSRQQLQHSSNAVMYGIHDVFPPKIKERRGGMGSGQGHFGSHI